jgi:hypothetical protein
LQHQILRRLIIAALAAQHNQIQQLHRAINNTAQTQAAEQPAQRKQHHKEKPFACQHIFGEARIRAGVRNHTDTQNLLANALSAATHHKHLRHPQQQPSHQPHRQKQQQPRHFGLHIGPSVLNP